MGYTNFPNGITSFGIPVLGGMPISTFGKHWFVDTINGLDGNKGTSADRPFKTMAKAISLAGTSDVIFFRGDVREEITGSNLVFDLTIVGCGTRPHHADLPATGYHTGAAAWRPPAVESGTTPLLTVRGRGWRFINILFDAPSDAAAVKLETNALTGTSEYSAGHAHFVGCRFDGGLTGIEDAGGAGFVTVENCDFRGLTNGITCSSTAVAIPLRWNVVGNNFHDNTNHLISSASRWTIKDNVFGKFTTESINTIFNTAQGEYNVLTGNVFSGDVDTAEGYTGDTTDTWAGNYAMTVTGLAVTTGSTNILPTT